MKATVEPRERWADIRVDDAAGELAALELQPDRQVAGDRGPRGRQRRQWRMAQSTVMVGSKGLNEAEVWKDFVYQAGVGSKGLNEAEFT